MKLNNLLALTDKMKISYKNMIKNYVKFFTKSQGAFMGEKHTYQAKEGFVDEATKRKLIPVATTVDEKFEYFIENTNEFITALFDQEKTNSSDVAKATLMVEGVSWGELTSLELLKLKSILESADLGNLTLLLDVIPVRSDRVIWNKTTNEEYVDRGIFETTLEEGEVMTTIKESYILQDPNLSKLGDGASYQPVVGSKDKTLPKGEYTKQFFTGEWSQRDKALALKRKDTLLIAVYKALKEANDIEAIKSTMTGEKIFAYILGE